MYKEKYKQTVRIVSIFNLPQTTLLWVGVASVLTTQVPLANSNIAHLNTAKQVPPEAIPICTAGQSVWCNPMRISTIVSFHTTMQQAIMMEWVAPYMHIIPEAQRKRLPNLTIVLLSTITPLAKVVLSNLQMMPKQILAVVHFMTIVPDTVGVP